MADYLVIGHGKNECLHSQKTIKIHEETDNTFEGTKMSKEMQNVKIMYNGDIASVSDKNYKLSFCLGSSPDSLHVENYIVL